MEKEQLKERVCEAIDGRREEIIEIGETILRNPELGFKEYKTAKLIRSKFKELGLQYKEKLALTGLKGIIKGKKEGPTVAVMGELDSMICYDHPYADLHTGAAHACGHNTQIAIMLGVGMGLVDSGIMNELVGNVVLFGTPAEEYIELEYRLKLREQRKIGFIGGKPELIRIGEFDDVDIALMVHSLSNTPERKVKIGGTTNAFIGKTVRFVGKEAHAGSSPEKGINALNAAMLAMIGIHTQRETFKDEDFVRVHSIITKGGDSVNVVPCDVRMEFFVRAKTVRAMMRANNKVDKALKAGALAVGAGIEIKDIPGYLPLINDEKISAIFRENISRLIGTGNIKKGGHEGYSTDMGDITQIIPGIHPWIGGFKGQIHKGDFEIVDPEMVYIISTKAIAMTVVDLLHRDAQLAKHTLNKFNQKMTKEEYLEFLNNCKNKIIEMPKSNY